LLHCTPDDSKFRNLTPAQKLWFLLNIQKDKTEAADQLLKLCQHIRPEAYFGQDSSPENTSTDFAADIMERLGRPLTIEEQLDLGFTPTFAEDEEDIDTIERI